MARKKKKSSLMIPVLPLRDIVVFPHMVVPLFVGRERSVKALEKVMASEEKKIFLITQKNPSEENPDSKDLYEIGTVGTMLQLLPLPDGAVKILAQGITRSKAISYDDQDGYLQAHLEPLEEIVDSCDELEALQRSIIKEFEYYVKLNRKIPSDIVDGIKSINEPSRLVDTIVSFFFLKLNDKQDLLEMMDVNKRLEKVLSFIQKEIAVLEVEKKIRSRVKKQMEKTQRDYYLNEQLKAIHKELHETEDGGDELSDLEEKIKKTKLSKEARERAQAELKKLRAMSGNSAESTVIRNYLDWILSIPWNRSSRKKIDLKKATEILNEDHFGLTKVKERILEYLAVQERLQKVRGPILCLVGPPGGGKTSLAQSIAKATGRTFVRVALGGLRDEAEIRGHRRTYIGSMPGRIIQAMKKAKVSNPLFLLDEIDKIGADWRGDPASVLLEVLDPEQNRSFNDHYLEVEYDLSQVMFVATANTLQMPQPLVDRLEIIRLSGYTEEEKLFIAKNHLIPKQEKLNGVKNFEWSIDDEVIKDLVRYYTKESGVRSLEREISNLARKVVKTKAFDSTINCVDFTSKNLSTYAGIRKFSYGQAEKHDLVGISTGLAWTEFGGDLLLIEVVSVPGKGNILITGKLGDVMKESVQAALSYVHSRAMQFGIENQWFDIHDIHLHVPEGAIPKDGPSAGIAICTAIVSNAVGIAVRKDVAMTGEITLRGQVLPIGGLKEKLLAAHRGGIKRVIIPEENKKDLVEVDQSIQNEIEIVSVSHVDQLLPLALVSMPDPLEGWNDRLATLSHISSTAISNIDRCDAMITKSCEKLWQISSDEYH
jgi:ATP-dependent Lon protease